MDCCLGAAILDALRNLECTPIRPENHFLLIRKCKDCLPYVVVKTKRAAMLRTSSGTTMQDTVEINAYFSSDKETQAFAYDSLVGEWLNSPGCLDLGDCGCFCLRGSATSAVGLSDGGTIRYSAVFSGFYVPSAESVSASE